MKTYSIPAGVTLFHADCRDVLRSLPDNSIDAVPTDPPYALVSIVKRFGGANAAPATGNSAYMRASAGFMGKSWDTGETAFSVEFWAEVYRVLKPGGFVAAFGASRGYHRMACAIEDAGFEIRDSLMWIYGTGFPKSQNVAKFIDATLISGSARTEDVRRLAMGDDYEPSGRGRVNYDHGGGSAMNGSIEPYEPATHEAQEFDGFGTALKPAFEPIVLARKPLSEGTVAANILRWRTGALNIDGCRIHTEGSEAKAYASKRIAPGATQDATGERHSDGIVFEGMTKAGRWPANVVHDGSDEVVSAFPTAGGQQGRAKIGGTKAGSIYGDFRENFSSNPEPRNDSGSAARFFYSAKASKADRAGSKHPTVKPLALMQWLARLITPPGGTVLDPFAGSGTTGAAAVAEGFKAVLCEREDEYVQDIRRRFDQPRETPAETLTKLQQIAAEFPDMEFTARLPAVQTLRYHPEAYAAALEFCEYLRSIGKNAVCTAN